MDDVSFEDRWAELLRVTRNWHSQWDIQRLVEQIARTTQELMGFQRAAVFLLNGSALTERSLWPQISESKADEISRLDIANDAVHAGRSVVLQDTFGNSKRSILCAPLTASRELLGALYSETRQPNRIVSDKDQRLLEFIAIHAATALEHVMLYQSAITDPLTGLFCHRHFHQEVDQAVRRAMRSEAPVSLLLMDLDHFKKLNDTCGHDAGNKCLLNVAAAMRSVFRSTDLLARFGGDEFEMLLPDTAAESANVAAEKLRANIGALKLPQNCHVTATIGIATFPNNAQNAEALFLNADAALYKAKEAGRNCIRISTQSDSVGTDSRKNGRPAPQDEERRVENSAAVASPTPNAMIDGHVILRRLGVGSTGEILLAMQPGLDRTVALKRPLKPHPSIEQTQAFEREARITAKLNHPGVVPVFALGRDRDERRYYTMRPLHGRTLEQILEGKRKGVREYRQIYTQSRLLEILQRVAETVAYAHQQNVLHLDLKPDNVIVGEFGEVTVIDWATDSSKHRSNKESTTLKLVGSPAFVAPEVMSDVTRVPTPPCDVFALGTMLYYILTDRLPFQRATAQESVQALLSCDAVPPETLRFDRGIDPMISELCMEALRLEPSARPSAHALADRLGRLIRREMDWATIQFGLGGDSSQSEWTAFKGEWTWKDDHWINEGEEGVLLWNQPVPGSFRIVCDGWVDAPGSELSLLGHRPAKGTRGYRNYGGYYFQLGAETNTVTKFARHEHDVFATGCLPLEPGRCYRLEMEYYDDDGLVYCSLDGELVFSYRELFPFMGTQVGFYAFGKGAHFRPVQIDRQNWNLQIPALRSADRFYSLGHFEVALEYYREISSNNPRRLASMEATLKAALCLAALERRDEAREHFSKLHGTSFEPFALAEQAEMEISGDPAGTDPERCVELCRQLFDKHKHSQASVRIFDIANRNQSFRVYVCTAKNYTRELELLEELTGLAVRSCTCRSKSHMRCLARLIALQCSQGLYKKALEEFKVELDQLSEAQRRNAFVQNCLAELDLANGGFYCPADITTMSGVPWQQRWVIFHCAVRSNQIDRLMHDFVPQDPLLMMAAHLCLGNTEEADKYLRKACQPEIKASLLTNTIYYLDAGWRVAESRQPQLLESYLKFPPSDHKHCQTAARFVQARWALESLDFEQAAKLILDIEPELGFEEGRRYILLQIMTSTLCGRMNTPEHARLRKRCDQTLSGTMLDLARIFCKEKEPRPGELWPDASWCPEWRLWLGLSLEAQGKKSEAREIVLQSLDPRYGLTHCQPAIRALLDRCPSE